jgi:hypothetical protein
MRCAREKGWVQAKRRVQAWGSALEKGCAKEGLVLEEVRVEEMWWAKEERRAAKEELLLRV